MGLTLITGASGFVGTHLAADMRNRGLPIRAVSRSESQGSSKVESYSPETDWRPHLHGVDTIIHLAARVHVMRETEADPLAAFRRANVDTTINLARQAAQAGVKRFIFMSTIKVNGEQTKPGRPFRNSDLPNPQDPYAISKAEAEAELWKLSGETGMEICVIRPPLVYGPGVGGNFRWLIKWVHYGLPSIFSSIDNRRSLIYVRNLTDFAIELIENTEAKNRHFLISDGCAFSTHRLMEEIAAAAGKKVQCWTIYPPILSTVLKCIGLQNASQRLLSSLEIQDADTREILGWQQPYDFKTAFKASIQPH